MVDVKPDEISVDSKAATYQAFSTATDLEEYGICTCKWVMELPVFMALPKAQAGELVEFETGVQAIVLNLEEDNVGVVLMGPGDGIKEGSRVKSYRIVSASIHVGEGFRRPGSKSAWSTY